MQGQCSGGGESLELVLSAAKTGIKTVFHFYRLSPKCHTKFVAAAAQFHSNFPLPFAPPLSPGNLFHLLPALSTLSNCCQLKTKRTMREKYTWNMFGSTFKRKPVLLSLPSSFSLSPSLSLSVSFMVNKNVSCHCINVANFQIVWQILLPKQFPSKVPFTLIFLISSASFLTWN